MKKTLLFILILVGVVGCGPSRSTIYVNESYDDQNFEERSLIVFPLADDAAIINNRENVAKDFPNDSRPAEEVIQDELFNKIIFEADRSLRKVNFIKTTLSPDLILIQTDSLKFRRINKKIGGDSTNYSFYIPQKEFLTSLSINPDILAIINTLVVEGGERTILGGGLQIDYEFILFDYVNNSVVSCGHKRLMGGSWESIFRQVARETLHYPFEWIIYSK